MKISIPEPVAMGLAEALKNVTNPDVRHLVREVTKRLADNRPEILTTNELAAVGHAIEGALTGLPFFTNHETQALLRTARPKVVRMMQRQALREAE